jgi:hypothetical protein
MMRIWNETSNCPQYCEWFDFEMRRRVVDLALIQGDIAIVFFVDINILYKPTV